MGNFKKNHGGPRRPKSSLKALRRELAGPPVITVMLDSTDPAVREVARARQETPAVVSKAATAPVLAPPLSDAEAARLSLSTDPAEREMAFEQMRQLLPATETLLGMLESQDPEDVEVAQAMIKTGWSVIAKLAGGQL